MTTVNDYRDKNLSVILSPANTTVQGAGVNGFTLQPGNQTVPANVQTCDAGWAEAMTSGTYRNFGEYMVDKCLHKKPFVDDRGVIHPAGSLSLPISNKRLRVTADILNQPPYPAAIPLMSHNYNRVAMSQARANAIRNNGTLQANATLYDSAKISMKNVMSHAGL